MHDNTPMHGRILVLDDEENYAEMLQKLLQQHHFLVDSSTKPDAALEALEEKDYQLVIADYKMPVMDGADFLLRARQINPNLPVIIVSGLMNTPELVKVANMSVTLVLEKPLDIENFIEHVSRFVSPLGDQAWKEHEAEAERDTGKRGGQLLTTYPRPLIHLSDECESSRLFVQNLKDATDEGRQAFIQAAAGCEYELIARELSLWMNAPDRRIYFFPAKALGDAGCQETLSEVDGSDPFSPVIVIGQVEELNKDEAKVLEQFVEEQQPGLSAEHGLTFLYFCAPQALENDDARLTASLAQRFSNAFLYLPKLHFRLPDLAAYARRYLDLFADRDRKPLSRELDPEALALLLRYPWPGDFLELVDVLRRAVALGPDGPMTAERLRVVLRRSGQQSMTPDTADPSLRTALRQRQRAIFQQPQYEQMQEAREVYAALGVPARSPEPDKSPAEQDLLFPDLTGGGKT